MKYLVPWRILTHERARSILAIAGIFIAVHLIFLQLGFFFSVPEGGMLHFNTMRFDLLLTSREYVFQAQSQTFPRRRLYQALAVPEVDTASPLYQGTGSWKNTEDKTLTRVFVMGVDLEDDVFTFPDVANHRQALAKRDTVIMDSHSKPSFGRLETGRRFEIDGRRVEIVGIYDVGIGFAGLGVAITSDVNLIRMFPPLTRDDVSLGLLRLVPGADPNSVAERLRRLLPADTNVLTRAELTEQESSHWMTRTSTGIVFGFGVVIAFIVGLIILYQTLASQVGRNLPEFATLKAIGYADKDLGGIVVRLALMMTLIAFGPAVIMSIIIYKITAITTLLPIYMTVTRVVGVLALTLVMAVASALLSIRVLRRADPVELF